MTIATIYLVGLLISYIMIEIDEAPIMEDEICIIQERKCFGCNDGIDKEELFCSHCRREN